MDEPLISILMPFKNTANYLPECINSILLQSEKYFELIAVNDNSTDESFCILQHLSLKDNRIKVFQNKGHGIIDALQLAFSKSKGVLITRMDSDDLMTVNKLKIMKNSLLENGEGNIALGLVKYFSENGVGDGYKRYEKWLNGLILKGSNFSEIYKECVIPSPCWMVFRNDFIKCGGFNSSIYPEDYDLTFRFYQNHLNCLPCNDILHFWRDYPTRTSRISINYADNTFINIKINYFLKLEFNNKRELVIWGAGKKGKLVAETLIKKNIPFVWVCNNPKKINKEIYGQKLLDFDVLDNINNYQSIVTVANENSQTEIKKYFTLRGKNEMKDYFFFC